MAGTLTIPATVLTPGTQVFGPAAAADADTLIVLTIDRSVTKGGTAGFRGQPATTTARLAAEQSSDGGGTWDELASQVIAGGPDRHGTALDTIGVRLWPGTGRQVRATVTVTGADVAVAGTLAISLAPAPGRG